MNSFYLTNFVHQNYFEQALQPLHFKMVINLYNWMDYLLQYLIYCFSLLFLPLLSYLFLLLLGYLSPTILSFNFIRLSFLNFTSLQILLLKLSYPRLIEYFVAVSIYFNKHQKSSSFSSLILKYFRFPKHFIQLESKCPVKFLCLRLFIQTPFFGFTKLHFLFYLPILKLFEHLNNHYSFFYNYFNKLK